MDKPVIKVPCKVCGRVLAVPTKDFQRGRYYFCTFPCFYVYDKIAQGWAKVCH